MASPRGEFKGKEHLAALECDPFIMYSFAFALFPGNTSVILCILNLETQANLSATPFVGLCQLTNVSSKTRE